MAVEKENDEGSEDDEELFQQRILKERNPWLTPTVLRVGRNGGRGGDAFAGPLVLSDLRTEEVKIRDPSHGCQTGVTAEGGATCTRGTNQQMKDMRPFERNIAEQVSDRVSDLECLSILSWNAGYKRNAK